MGITFTDGTITTDGTEQTIFDITSDKHFATWIFLHNMQSGDTIVVKISVRDENGNALRLYNTYTYTGVQSAPAVFFAYLTTKRYKVTIQRTGGTDRAYTWQRIEVV